MASVKVNVNDLTFGVEIETCIPVNSPVQVGGHGNGRAIPQLPGWKADGDPSIRAGNGYKACEFVSGIFKGVDGLRQLLADLEVIKGFGARVNGSCGLHIHVGFNKADAVASAKLMHLIANFEKAIFASTGTKARERGRWCKGLSRYGSVDGAKRHTGCDRYHVANFSTCKPTIEFRAFGATLNPGKLVGYVRLCIAIVERALNANRTTNWTAKKPCESSPIHRSGDGYTAITRLFYQLGWTKGRESHVYGDLSGAGLPTIKASKKELVRLAKKYDADGVVATPAPRPQQPAPEFPPPMPAPHVPTAEELAEQRRVLGLPPTPSQVIAEQLNRLANPNQ